MRDKIIKSLDIIIWVIATIMVLAGLIVGLFMLAQGQVMGIGLIFGGVFYAILFAGSFFLLIGVYNNTKRTAEAVEKMAGGS